MVALRFGVELDLHRGVGVAGDDAAAVVAQSQRRLRRILRRGAGDLVGAADSAQMSRAAVIAAAAREIRMSTALPWCAEYPQPIRMLRWLHRHENFACRIPGGNLADSR